MEQTVSVMGGRKRSRAALRADVRPAIDRAPVSIAAERARIAQELHDSVGQLVTGLGLHLAGQLADATTDGSRSALEQLLFLVERADRELRDVIETLLDDRVAERQCGLVEALIELCRRFETATAVSATVTVFGPLRADPAIEDVVYRVAAEALRNIERHAEASVVEVELHVDAWGSIRLTVQDDGVGLNGHDPLKGGGRLGLRTMKRRVEHVGGTLRTQAVVPRGLLVEAVIPGRGIAHADGTGGRH